MNAGRPSQLRGRSRLCDLSINVRQAAAELEAERGRFAALAGSLPVVVQADLLFPTPPELARQIVNMADIRPGMRVLEPSAGTGNLLAPLPAGCDVVAVEIVTALVHALRQRFPAVYVECADFLQCNGDLGQFDRILMNPPWRRGLDIQHIEHARRFLAPGGEVVAICYGGEKQRRAFAGCGEWFDLPDGAFRSSGTNAPAAICVLTG